MELKIKPITVTKCVNKKTGEVYTRLDYLALRDGNKSEKVKGKIVQNVFLNADAFDKIPNSMLFEEVTAMLDYQENLYNPMKPRIALISLQSKNEFVDLL